MKACDVRILPALDPGESYIEPSFLLVETTVDEHGTTVTTIDHITTHAAEEKGWSVKPVMYWVPMVHSDAREWAVAYAASRDVPMVYELDTTAGHQSLQKPLNRSELN